MGLGRQAFRGPAGWFRPTTVKVGLLAALGDAPEDHEGLFLGGQRGLQLEAFVGGQAGAASG